MMVFGPYYRIHYIEQGFHFGRTFAEFSVFGEWGKIFQQFMRTAYYTYQGRTRTKRNLNFILPHRIFISAYSTNAQNELTVALFQ